jgi:hypothetical protein
MKSQESLPALLRGPRASKSQFKKRFACLPRCGTGCRPCSAPRRDRARIDGSRCLSDSRFA